METVSLAIASYNPKMTWLFEMLESIKDFDEVVLYCRGDKDRFLDGRVTKDKTQAGDLGENYDFTERKAQIDRFIEQHPEKRIRFLTDTVAREGSSALNYVINQTSGDWVMPFSDDDKFHTENLRGCIRKIKNGDYSDSDIVHSIVTVNGNESWGSTWFTLENLRTTNQLPFSSFYRRVVFNELGGYVEEPTIDWGFWIRAMMLGFKFGYYDKPIYDYRFINQSTMPHVLNKYGGIGKIRQIILDNCDDFIRSRQVH